MRGKGFFTVRECAHIDFDGLSKMRQRWFRRNANKLRMRRVRAAQRAARNFIEYARLAGTVQGRVIRPIPNAA